MQTRARAARVPLIFLQHFHATVEALQPGSRGWAIHPDIAPTPADLVLGKTASDGFYQTELGQTLEDLGATTIVVCGLQTEFCVDATCRSALSHGFDVILASGAHTTGNAVLEADQTIAHHEYALANLAHPDHAITVSRWQDIAYDTGQEGKQ